MISAFSFFGSYQPKAIIVLLPGSNGDGRDMVNDSRWTALALELDLLLVGCLFRDFKPSGVEDYCSMGQGGGERLLRAIEDHCHTLRVDLPGIYLWGFSAGGQFAYEFACTYPAFTHGFVANKGGVYYTALASEKARKVPGLIFVGAYDAEWRRDILKGIHGLNTTFGAQWRLIEEPCDHAVGKSVELGIQFFRRLIKGGVMKKER